jgi:hypothetical protein
MSPKVGGHRGLEDEGHVSPLIRRRKHFDGGIEEEEKEVESLRRELAEAKMMIKKIQDSILAPKPSIKKMEPRTGMGSQASKYLQGTIFSNKEGRGAYESTSATKIHTPRSTRSEDFDDLFNHMGNSDEESGEYPTPSELKMVKVEAFDGKEIYTGLGSNFAGWAKRFVRSIEVAQRISNKVWKDSVKIDRLSHCLKGTALDLFNSRVDAWCAEETSLEYVLKKMETRFTVVLQPAQILTKFTKAKQHRMSWSEHLMYLIALNKTAGGGYDKLILQNVVEYASSSLRTSLRAR